MRTITCIAVLLLAAPAWAQCPFCPPYETAIESRAFNTGRQLTVRVTLPAPMTGFTAPVTWRLLADDKPAIERNWTITRTTGSGLFDVSDEIPGIFAAANDPAYNRMEFVFGGESIVVPFENPWWGNFKLSWVALPVDYFNQEYTYPQFWNGVSQLSATFTEQFPVPEPATWGLAVVGLIVLAGRIGLSRR